MVFAHVYMYVVDGRPFFSYLALAYSLQQCIQSVCVYRMHQPASAARPIAMFASLESSSSLVVTYHLVLTY